jgi:hypothetical protein
VWALFDVDIEDAFEQPGPTHAPQVEGREWLGLIRGGRVRLRIGGGARDNRGTQLGIGRKHAVEADEM